LKNILRPYGSRWPIKKALIHPTPTYQGEHYDPRRLRTKQRSEAKRARKLEATTIGPRKGTIDHGGCHHHGSYHRLAMGGLISSGCSVFSTAIRVSMRCKSYAAIISSIKLPMLLLWTKSSHPLLSSLSRVSLDRVRVRRRKIKVKICKDFTQCL